MASLDSMPPEVIRPAVLSWLGFTKGNDGKLAYDESSQLVFTDPEIEALFEGEGSKLKNDWLTEVNGVEVTLKLYNMLGCRWEIDCGGARPRGVKIEFDPQTGMAEEGSAKVDYVGVERMAAIIGIKEAEAEEDEEEEEAEEGGEDDKEKGGSGSEEEEDDDWELQVKELQGEGTVAYLKVFDEEDGSKPVVPGEEMMALGLGKAKTFATGTKFDLSKGGVDLVVFVAKPQPRVLEEEGGEEKKVILWLPEEGFVRGMARLMGKMLAKGSVIVLIAPLIMPHEWMEGLRCLQSSWTFGVRSKVSFFQPEDMYLSSSIWSDISGA